MGFGAAVAAMVVSAVWCGVWVLGVCAVYRAAIAAIAAFQLHTYRVHATRLTTAPTPADGPDAVARGAWVLADSAGRRCWRGPRIARPSTLAPYAVALRGTPPTPGGSGTAPAG